MARNPYFYTGALDLARDELVCASRKDDVEKVVDKIIRGEYCAILGPRQIGKTTFLRQVEKGLFERMDSKNYCILYFDIGVFPKTNEGCYEWLKERLHKEVPSESIENIDECYRKYGPEFQFFNFLVNFKPKNDKKKIVLLFDEIEGLPSIREFLGVWRKVHHERLKRNSYSVVITGSTDLIASTEGNTSPFNVVEILYLKDLSEAEGRRLIDVPFRQNNIEIGDAAKEALLSLTAGHPQLLQHVCSLLFEIANKQKRSIDKEDIDAVVKILFVENVNLDLLKKNLENDALKTLIKRILKGENVRFHPNKTFSIEGVGSIIENDMGFCTIRNELYKEFLKGILFNESHIRSEPMDENQYAKLSIPNRKPKVFICYSSKDKKWKELLCKHLKALACQEVLSIWDDTKIEAGQLWYQEIEKNINDSAIAIFLISGNFLTSDFILNDEIPTLLTRKKLEGIAIFPILVEHCLWSTVSWLAEMEIRPKNRIPISRGTEDKQNERIVDILMELSVFLED